MKFVHLLLALMISATLSARKIREGTYRATLLLDANAGTELPFIFDIATRQGKQVMIIRNADERIVVDEIRRNGDSMIIRLPVFDTEFHVKESRTGLNGYWVNNYRKDHSRIPFTAVYNESRRFLFEPGRPDPVFEGRWETTFSPEGNASKAVAIFNHSEQTDFLTGTFLAETGDYRYLEGMKHSRELSLSCFDGSHAFLFTGTLTADGTIDGTFYSGSHWRERWIAKRNDYFQLRDAGSITTAKEPGLPVTFTFPDLKGVMVSSDDEKFRDKALIIQLLGSWCPNCMDESRFLTGLYKKYNGRGLEIIGVAFEKTADPQTATEQVKRMVERLGVNYTVLLSGQVGKEAAAASFRWLSGVSAFPTTIFLDRKHRPVKILTGFSGPATGDAHKAFIREADDLAEKILTD